MRLEPPENLDTTMTLNRLLRNVLLISGLGLAGASLAGCGGSTAGAPGATATQTPEQLFQSIAASLKEEKAVILATQTLLQQLAPQNVYQHAVQQLNLYLNLRRDLADQLKLDARQRELIERGLLGGLTRPERQLYLEEVQRRSFTELDVHHLDACFLFRDAAGALRADLGLAPSRKLSDLTEAEQLQLALQAFERVMRQVDLRPEKPGVSSWPAHEVLRRGTGSAEERSRVFLALLEQLELDAGYLTRHIEVVGENNQREEREVPWLPAARIGKELYLFDPNLGKAIPGPGGKGVATLTQVRADAKLLEVLGRPDQPYEVKPPQLAKASLLLACSLPAFSPRMAWLENQLADAQNRVVLYQNLPGILKRLQESGLGVEVKLWTNRDGLPALLLARHVENARKDPRWRNNLEIVPRDLMPAWVLAMAARLDPQPDIGEGSPPEVIAARLRPDYSQPMFQYFDLLFLRLRLEPGGVRDLLVRGKPEQSVDRILWFEKQLEKSVEAWRSFENPVPVVRQQWQPLVIKAVEQLQRAKAEQAPSEQIQALARRVEGLWIDGQLHWRFLSNEWAALELREQLTYAMGLAKMELAVRAELRAERALPTERADLWAAAAREWQSAAAWFSRYQAMLYSLPRIQTSPLLMERSWSAAVRRHLETCQQRLARCKQAQTQVARATETAPGSP